MFSRFFGKGNTPEGAPAKKVRNERGLEVIEDDPETVWGLWDSALADQDSRFSASLSNNPADSVRVNGGFPQDASDAPTQPMALDELPIGQRVEHALQIVEVHHQRIANTIRSLWGYKECGVYITKLIMSGGDGMGQARIGFNQNAVDAMMTLADLHDQQCGSVAADAGAFDPSVRTGLDGSR